MKGLKFSSLRTFLENNISLITYKNQGDDVFKNVQMPTSTIIGYKGNENPWSCSTLDPRSKLTNKISNNNKKLYEISHIQRGLEIGKCDVFDKGQFPCLTGTTVDKYIPKSVKYITAETLALYGKDEKYFNGERILLRETGSSLLALYLKEHIYSNRSLYSVLITDTTYLVKYVLACINSRLMQFYYGVVFKADTELFPKIRIAQAKLLPICSATIEQQQQIISLVDVILEKKSKNFHANTSVEECTIDEMIYNLYGLTEDEVKIVEDS